MTAWRVAADVAEQLHAVPVAHQHLCPAFQHVIVAGIRHHQLMPDVTRPLPEQHALLYFQCFGVEVPTQGRLDRNPGELIYVGDIGHALIVNVLRGKEGIVPEFNWWGNKNWLSLGGLGKMTAFRKYVPVNNNSVTLRCCPTSFIVCI